MSSLIEDFRGNLCKGARSALDNQRNLITRASNVCNKALEQLEGIETVDVGDVSKMMSSLKSLWEIQKGVHDVESEIAKENAIPVDRLSQERLFKSLMHKLGGKSGHSGS